MLLIKRSGFGILSRGVSEAMWVEVEGSQPVSRVLSRMTIHLGRSSPSASSDLPENTRGPRAAVEPRALLFGLAPGGVCPATPVARCAVRSYRTISTLPVPKDLGGVFSVALSVGSRRPGITWHPALRSPDFPPPRTAAAIRPTPVLNLRSRLIQRKQDFLSPLSPVGTTPLYQSGKTLNSQSGGVK